MAYSGDIRDGKEEALIQQISRFPTKNSIFMSDQVGAPQREVKRVQREGERGGVKGRKHPSARYDSLSCHVCALIRGHRRRTQAVCVGQSTWLDVIARGYIVSDEAEGCLSVA